MSRTRRNHWTVGIAVGAVALATCGLAELGGSDAEGQLAPVGPRRESPATPPAPSRCEAARGEAELLSARVTCEDCAPGQAVLELTFDRTVDAAEALELVSIEPEVALASRSGRCARRVLAGGPLAPQTDYTVTVTVGGETRTLSVGTGGGDPYARMPAPMAVLAPDAELPLLLNGVRRPRLRVMRLRADEIARAAESAGLHPSGRDPAEQLPAAWRSRLREIPVDPSAGDDDGLQRVDVFGGQPGPVLAMLEAPGVASRVTIAQRATEAVVLKVGRAGGVVWVADPRTGEPVRGAAVTIWEGTESRARGRTDASGLYRLPAEARLRSGSPERPLRAVVQRGDHVTYASEAFRTGIDRWQLELPSIYEGGVRGMVTPERGIYRPGETVHLLGIARRLATDGSLQAPRGRVNVEVRDPDGNVVHQSRAALTRFGTFRDELALGDGARLGRYQVTATLRDRPARRGRRGRVIGGLTERFEVGEYRPDTFAVDVPPAGPAEQVDGEVVLPIRARYLYGAPVADANADWTLSWRPRRIVVPGAEGFHFGDADSSYSRFLTSGSLPLAADGSAELRIPRALLPVHEHAQAVDLVFEASVRDAANDTVAGRTVQTIATRERWVGVRNQRWIVNADRGWNVEAIAVTPQGQPVAGHPITLRLVHPTWRTHAERGTGGVRYDGEWEDVVVAERELTSAAQASRVHFDLPSGGRYRVEVIGDAGEVLAEARVWAYGRDSGAPVYNHPRMEVLADRTEYAPGDHAQLFAQVPWERSIALVTVEREGVMEARVERLSGASTAIDVAIADEHAPNVFVGVAALPIGSESPASGVPLRVGYRELPVSAAQRRLDVQVRPAQDDYEPGQTALVDVEVRDHRGRPVRAEVTLWAADEGVLRLTGYQTPDVFSPAYARHGNGVSTAASAAQWTQRDPYTWPDGGGDAPAGEGGAMRSRFLSTAFFSSRGVTTDGRGRARVRFELPDNLTAWRVMAAVADPGERFGRAEATMTTSKPLQAMPTLPRFLTQGDLVDAGVVVHNHTGDAGEAVVRLSVDGPAEVVGGDVQRVRLEDGAQTPARFPIVVRGTGEVTVRAHAELGGASDGWRRTLPAHPASTWSSRTIGGGELRGEREERLWMPRRIERGQAELLVTVSHGVYAAMESGLDSLIRYPHGCVEQTTSGLIPMVLLEDLMRDLGSGRMAGEEHRRRMAAAIEHVLDHQNSDGGFGLWPASSSEGFLTAYALWGLLTSRDHGYTVDASRIDRATAYLEAHMTHGDDMHGQFNDQEIAPFAAYVLAYARQNDRGLAARLAGDEPELTRFSVGLVANAQSRREQDADALLTAIRESVDGQLVHDPSGGGRFMRYGTDLRATSSAVQALVAAERRDEADALVEGILRQRRSDGSWGSTYNNMWALYALTSYAQAGARGEARGGEVTVELDGRAVGSIALAGETRARQIRIPASSLPAPGQSGRITLRGPDGADLRYQARLRYVTRASEQHPQSHGLTVTRELLDAAGQPVRHPAVGDVVRVRLTVRASQALDQVAVMDYLPAGFEAIDSRLATRGTGGAEAGGSTWSWQEVHDERVTFFANHLSGTRTAEYLAQVSRSGEFMRPAPRAEAMYDPEVYGLGAIERVIVTQRN